MAIISVSINQQVKIGIATNAGVPNVALRASVKNTMNISSNLGTGLGIKVRQNAKINDNFNAQTQFNLKFNELIAIHDTLKPLRNIGITFVSSIGIHDNNVSSAAYLEKIVQSANIESYIELYENGKVENNFDTWVINYESNAVSRYTNFNFNGFSKIGDKYYATNSNGLYLLDGTKDEDSIFIPAKIVTGNIDLSGIGVKSNARDIELYVKNDGTMTLRAYASDNQYFDYKLSKVNEVIAGSRVKLGMGRKAVYWQFELTNDQGTDFELDTTKIYKLVTGRVS